MSKLLSQGGFGCVYYPGINCEGETEKNNKEVTKLQAVDFNAFNEIKIGEKVKMIPNYQLFFIPVIKHCEISLASINPQILSKCEVVSRNKDLKYMLMSMDYIPNESFYNFLTDVSKSKKSMILNILETYSFLLNTYKLLVADKLVHFDTKSENILYNSDTHNPLLIDFGISFYVPDLNPATWPDYFYVYHPDYYIWAPEIHCINYLVNFPDANMTNNLAKKIADECTKHNKALVIFSPEFVEEYRNSSEEFLRKFVGKKRENIIRTLISYYNTWDNYSLSILYLKLIGFLFNKRFFKNHLIILFSQLLLYNISPDPNKRKSLDETIRMYNNIFFKEEQVRDYKELLSDLDYDKDEFTTKLMVDIQDLKKPNKK